MPGRARLVFVDEAQFPSLADLPCAGTTSDWLGKHMLTAGNRPIGRLTLRGGGVGARTIHARRWTTVWVTRRAAAALVSVRIAVGALFALGLVQFWIALAALLRLSIVGGRLDAHPDLSAPIGDAILRPYWVSALGGVGALGLGVALAGAAWFVSRFGLRARWPALGLVAVAVAFQLMAALVWLTRARNRPVSGGGVDGLVTLPVAGAAPSTVYDEAVAAVAWFGRADDGPTLEKLLAAG